MKITRTLYRMHVPGKWSKAVLVVIVLIFVFTYYHLRWNSMESIIETIDHGNQLFEDFIQYYYPMAKAIFSTSVPVPGYYYSAFFALVISPIGAMDPYSALWCWGVVQLASLAALCVIPLIRFLRLKALALALYVGIFVTSYPLLHNLRWGQVSVILIVAVIASFHFYTRDRRVIAGALIAAAAAVKYYPALFLLYFIVKRDLRVCFSFAITFSLLYILFPAISIGMHNLIAFHEAGAAGAPTSDMLRQAINSQYCAHVLERVARIALRKPIGASWIRAFNLTGYAICIWNVYILWLIDRKGLVNKLVFSLVLLFVSIPFVIKSSWPHYFGYLPFCQFALLTSLAECHTWRLLKYCLYTMLCLSVALSSIFVFDLFPSWQYYNELGMLFLANLLLLVMLYFIVFLQTAAQAVSQR